MFDIDQMATIGSPLPQVLFQHQVSKGRCYFFRTIEASSMTRRVCCSDQPEVD
jgi:hypothetical protein